MFLNRILHQFFAHYHGMVRYHAAQQASQKVRDALLDFQNNANNNTSNSIIDSTSSSRTQSLALQWALQQRGVSDVVMGMTQPRHVEAALQVAKSS